jgi:hypothetical protein
VRTSEKERQRTSEDVRAGETRGEQHLSIPHRTYYYQAELRTQASVSLLSVKCPPHTPKPPFQLHFNTFVLLTPGRAPNRGGLSHRRQQRLVRHHSAGGGGAVAGGPRAAAGGPDLGALCVHHHGAVGSHVCILVSLGRDYGRGTGRVLRIEHALLPKGPWVVH